MEDYLAIANSWQIWVCAFVGVVIVLIQTVLFAKLCLKNAPLVGMSSGECKKSFTSGMVTSIGPSLSCFISAITMISVVGGPISWLRLSMIGAADTELVGCTTGAAAYGVQMGGPGYDITVMASSWLTMALNGCGFMLVVLLLTPQMGKIRGKIGGGDAVWLDLISCGAAIGLFSYLSSSYLLGLTTLSPSAWACVGGIVAMGLCQYFSKKVRWLKEYGLGIAIVAGILAGLITQ